MGFDRSLLSLLRRTLVAICLPALLLAACDQSPEERAEALLKTAQERLVDGDLAAAVIDLKNVVQTDPQSARSEEHTSELQSLMRISYAVFCLKKKKKQHEKVQKES